MQPQLRHLAQKCSSMKNPTEEKTWGFHAKKSWYIGPYFDHYRTVQGFLPSTGAVRLSDTVKFKHHAIEIPTLTPADQIFEAAKQLAVAIR